ncbi:MAG: hypothetical protein ACRDT8_01945 [Micromonosporaceae bacterium]
MAFDNGPINPQSMSSPPRPPVVTAAVGALLAHTGVGVLIALITVISITGMNDRYVEIMGQNFALEDREQTLFTARLSAVIFIVYSILGAVVAWLCAVGVLKRSRVGRPFAITACVLFLIGDCCSGCSLGISTEMRFGTEVNGVPPVSLADLLGDGPWLADLVLVVVQMLLLLTAVVLLALPAARPPDPPSSALPSSPPPYPGSAPPFSPPQSPGAPPYPPHPHQ